MSQLLIEPHYLGSLEYYALLLQHDEILLEVNDTFPKQTYRNRAYVLGSNKIQTLILPMKYSNGDPTKSVKVDNSQRWVKDHWGACYSAYGKAPFFEYYVEDFKSLWNQQFENLIDLNLAFLKLTFKVLQIDTPVRSSDRYHVNHPTDYRNIIIPKKSFTNRRIYHPYSYRQLFGDTFVPNLSILDLIFCEGPNAVQILRHSYLSE